LTDGRPSAFTGTFLTKSPCNGASSISGNLQSYVGLGWPPPTTDPSHQYIVGLLGTKLLGSYPLWLPGEPGNPATPDGNCAYAVTPIPNFETNVYKDLASGNFQPTAGPIDNVGASYNLSYPYYLTPGLGVPTQGPYYSPASTSASNPQAVRYAAFNVADNMATYIRQDTTLSPMLFVIGLNYTSGGTEALDADWLARVANDPNYVTVGSDPNIKAAGQSVYNNSQTPGMYCNSTPATLNVCFAQVTSQLLRLIQ
jgi:hypothetical protein